MADLMQEGAPEGRGRVRVELGSLFYPHLSAAARLPSSPKGRGNCQAITFRPRATVVLYPTIALLDFARTVSTNSQSFDTFSGVMVSAM